VPWSSVELSDVLAFSGDARLTAAWDADDDPQRDAWFAIIRDSAVAQIRAKVSARGKNPLDANPTRIPPEFVELAVLRMLIAILGRVGPTAGSGGQGGADPLGLTSDQRSRLTQLEKDLDSVAKGESGVSTTDDPESTASQGPTGPSVERVSGPGRLFSRTTLSGL
jgi:hypothetical protein